MEPVWKIERLSKKGILRITMDVKLEQVPVYLMEELTKSIAAGNFIHTCQPLFNSLSLREKEILLMVTQYLTNKQIAARLNIAEHTVKTHRKNILRKLQCKSLKELEAYKVFYKE